MKICNVQPDRKTCKACTMDPRRMSISCEECEKRNREYELFSVIKSEKHVCAVVICDGKLRLVPYEDVFNIHEKEV